MAIKIVKTPGEASTLGGSSQDNLVLPCYYATGDRWYVIDRSVGAGNDPDTSFLEVWKSGADPLVDTWTRQDTANEPTFLNRLRFTTMQVGDEIHFQFTDNDNGNDFKYVIFDMATDSWGTPNVWVNNPDSGTPSQDGQIVEKGNTNIPHVFVHTGEADKIMGTNYGRVDVAEFNSSGTLVASQSLDSGGQTQWCKPRGAKNPNNDNVHCLWGIKATDVRYAGTLIDSGGAGSGTVNQDDNDTGDDGGSGDGVTDRTFCYDDGGTIRLIHIRNASGTTAWRTQSHTVVSNAVVLGSSSIFLGPATFEHNIGLVHDPVINRLYLVSHGDSGDGNGIFLRQSDNNGITWTSAVLKESRPVSTDSSEGVDIALTPDRTQIACRYITDDVTNDIEVWFVLIDLDDPQVSELPAETLDLTDNDPTIVTTENNVAQLDAETIVLTNFAITAVVPEDSISQLPAETLDLADFDPTVVSTDNQRSLLDAETLDLTGFDPQAVTTENKVSLLDAETLDLVDFDPQATTTENNFALLAAAALAVATFNPTVVTTENNISQIESETLTLTDHDPQATVTDNNFSQLPGATLDLADNDPTIGQFA
jgi:hypothetical protein